MSNRGPCTSNSAQSAQHGFIKECTLPRGSKYPIFEVSGPQNHTLNGFWNQKPQMLGTWTLWVIFTDINSRAILGSLGAHRTQRTPSSCNGAEKFRADLNGGCCWQVGKGQRALQQEYGAEHRHRVPMRNSLSLTTLAEVPWSTSSDAGNTIPATSGHWLNKPAVPKEKSSEERAVIVVCTDLNFMWQHDDPNPV